MDKIQLEAKSIGKYFYSSKKLFSCYFYLLGGYIYGIWRDTMVYKQLKSLYVKMIPML